ncbi:MAG: AraC family transcriptional regulator [Rhodoferax sp.]|jgi:AraC-like DNA-binding protein|nr:AraC family transcriptional regulator [Rhodoferax sp.]
MSFLKSVPTVPEVFEFSCDRAEFRTVTDHPGVELYRASIVRHAFEPHTHEAFGFGVIEQGVERFRYRGIEHLAAPDAIILMNPDVLHTGRAESQEGWQYRMLYIEPDALRDVAGEDGWWFSDAVIHADQSRARLISHLLQAMWQTQDSLEFDCHISEFVGMLRPFASNCNDRTPEGAARFAPVIDYMHANLDASISLEDLAGVAGLSRFHFLRQFQTQYHSTPHQMLMAIRLYTAKCLLAKGLAPALVAAAVGLTDQAHLTRAFVRRYGVPPARYQRQVRT